MLKLLDKVVDETVIEIFTTQTSITGGDLDLENTLLDGQSDTSKVPPPRSKIGTLLSPIICMGRPWEDHK